MLPSILLSHGSHCRLENIHPETGCWIEDESFQIGETVVCRKAGEPADPRLMTQWREWRSKEPELFRHLRVWQQPAATMDTIIWRWQTELEASEYRQALRVTDCCTSCWTEQAKEAAFLLGQINCPVAASCTPLQQPTDTHFAKPAKDAGRAEKERLRELMRLACIELQQPVKYCSTKKEILQVASAMHSRMVSLNRESDTVLQSCRAGGWFAYRPDSEGKLVEADTQLWAQANPQAAGRVSARQLQGRFDWLDDAGKPLMQDADWQKKLESEGRELVPASKAEVHREELTIEAAASDLFTVQEYQQAAKALTHPKFRTDNDLVSQIEGLGFYQAEMQKRQRQTEKSEKIKTAKSRAASQSGGQRKQKARVLRQDLAEIFASRLTEASGSVEKRLKDFIPAIADKSAKKKTKGQTKAAKKTVKKASKLKLGLLRKTKGWQQRKNAKKTKARLEDKAGGALFLGDEGGALTGKQVRLVDFNLPELLRNSQATVDTHYSTGIATVVTASGTVRSFPHDRLYQLTGKEKLPLSEIAPDMRTCTLQQKQRGLAASGAQLQTKLKANSLLETPELGAAWEELGFRAASKGDAWPNSLAAFLNPVVSSLWLEHWKKSPGSPDSQEDLETCRTNIAGVVSQPRQAAFVALPVTAGGHHTLLLLVRQATPDSQGEPNRLVVVYKDSLPGKGSQACRQHAQIGLSFLSAAFGPGSLAQTVVPPLAPSAKQTDSHSCGFWVTNWVEEEYRLLRGEGVFRLTDKFTAKAESLNRYNKAVMAAREKPVAAAKSRPAPLPVLTTGCPAQPSVPAASQPTVLPPSAPLSQCDMWGCSRCRWAQAGCASCNPAKMAAKHSKS